MTDCPTIAARGTEAKKSPPNGPDGGTPKMKANLDEGNGNL